MGAEGKPIWAPLLQVGHGFTVFHYAFSILLPLQGTTCYWLSQDQLA